ncbi:TetR/AcrR family transcriptional regulator [Sphingomonas sp.]|uniref:TetR/AcrR family transcriptional regulator n=1 Tax=Sphingomonas sp. TaxID=28214 RepID=UPI001B164BCD|nr:TetR/AcrR family transcriptional regulator [Sphingomonas sp.]MBO9711761.1 TetR family transcriptional regulator [Sphingomonas sp.]
MAKADAITALMDSATTVFSHHGYEGASLRDIAAGAGLPLSTINAYFGTKADLFVAVMQGIWREIEAERRAMLAERLAMRGVLVPDLRDLVTALTKPLVARARSSDPATRRAPRLMRQWFTAPFEVREAMRRQNFSNASLRTWIESVRAASPGLSTAQAVWGFSFIVGALYSYEMMDNRYDEILDPGTDDPDTVAEYLVNFAVAGMQGIGGAPGLDKRP